MKAVTFASYGDASVLEYGDRPDPECGPDDIVLRVGAVGVNHVDIDMRNGTSRFPLQLPHTLGLEAGGTVVETGSGVSGFSVGDRVTAMHQLVCYRCDYCRAGVQQHCRELRILGVNAPGAYAEYLRVPARSLRHLPDTLSFEAAAVTQTSAATAWHCLVTRGRLRPGEWVLVSAAGSGVGSIAIRLAKLLGARVITTAGSAGKLELARASGADAVIDYRTEDVAAAVRDITDGRGVDVALEHIGGDNFTACIASLAIRGRMVVCGGHAGETVPLDLIALFRSEHEVIGCARADETEIQAVLDLTASGALVPVIDSVFPLAQAAQAHRRMEDRLQYGKLVLLP
ncbi:zinc-binding dehydrogenase [Rathayibacter sp. ZW T2_19]|uniref:Zinc-binding dehydrogenase n=1 Tax=Rathayibacter rubneri TaxID=2950106 RepID=A0A9X2DVE2_9MICO|nr:zinc-binding dehydrogenase [Rathayibacter rubneri]MCM6761214.1 zinc-binding dehydrogenase [Rathayibacter rubneri]